MPPATAAAYVPDAMSTARTSHRTRNITDAIIRGIRDRWAWPGEGRQILGDLRDDREEDDAPKNHADDGRGHRLTAVREPHVFHLIRPPFPLPVSFLIPASVEGPIANCPDIGGLLPVS